MRLVNHPVLCNYYLTYRCNASCSFCDIWEQPSPYASIETLEKNLNDLKSLGVKVIDFTGGEPLLHRALPKFLAMAKELGFITTITTNGLLYPKKAEELRGLVDMLHFSLDSSEKEEHDKMRRVACFDKVMESIDMALELGERPDILFTAFKHNLDQIDPVYNRISRPNNLVLILNPVFDYNQVNTGENLDENDLDFLTKWGKKKLVYLNQGIVELIRDGGNNIESPVCRAGTSTIVISPDNKLISPCYHLQKDKFDLSQSLANVYHSQKVKESLSQAGKYEECEGCTINCYMQPSFTTDVNKYFWKSLPGTLKYNRIKGTWKQLIS